MKKIKADLLKNEYHGGYTYTCKFCGYTNDKCFFYHGNIYNEKDVICIECLARLTFDHDTIVDSIYNKDIQTGIRIGLRTALFILNIKEIQHTITDNQ